MLEYFTTAKTPTTAPIFDGIWRNELNSEMELVATAGKISGKYRTGVGLPTPTEEFDLIGFYSDDLLSFTVNFGPYGSLTSWVGQHTHAGGTEIIKTLWLLARNVQDPDEPTKMWGSILTGSNDFHRVP